MKKIIFLGYSKKETKIIEKLKENNNYQVFNTKNKIKLKDLDGINFIICFGYRHIIANEILNKKMNIINLHISYLPYNKGAHPNFWSFAENTPSGITINRIDKGIDTGNIIYQKLLDFELNKNKKKLTFKKTYSTLISEIENLFLSNKKNILSNSFEEYKQIGKGSYHKSHELPNILKSWNQNIFDTITKYQLENEIYIEKKLRILNDIENTRKINNINSDDDKISKLFKKLNER